MTPIREIDGVTIGNGACGNVTRDIQTTYFDAVNGKLDQYSHWLTPIHQSQLN